MTERTIYILPKSGVTITRVGGGATTHHDIIGNALNGDAFSWEVPYDLALTFSAESVAITFDDADGVLSDDPFSGAEVVDQRLTQPVTVNGVTYTPSPETLRWQWPPPVNVEDEYEVTLFDGLGNAYHMVGVSITQGYTSTVVGVMFEGPAPPPGTTLYYLQGVSGYSGAGESTPIPDGVPCFLAGTRIETPGGPRAVEDLRAGDRVLTLDHGAQPIRWIGRSMVCGLGPLAPIRIAAGTYGNRRDLCVSPNHRLFLRSVAAELHFGAHEVLVPAKFLIDGARVRPAPRLKAMYLHLLLDRHEAVFSEGIASESLFAGAVDQGVLDAAAVADLRVACPELVHRLCRPSLTRAETRLLLAAPGADLRGARLTEVRGLLAA